MSGRITSEHILAEARSWLGTPYRHQASRKHIGCDCLGLLRGIWRALYGCEPETIPAYSGDWDLMEKRDELLRAAGRHLVLAQDMEPASVLIFRWQDHLPAKHLAILSRPRTIIHAYERAGVVETTLGTHWRTRVAGVFNFPERVTPSSSGKK